MHRPGAFILLMCAALALQAAETWRWVDADGVVHYSDVPVPGAERIDMASHVVRPKNPEPARPITNVPRTSPAQDTVPFVPYTRCVVARPANDEVFQGVQNVGVTVEVEPGLQEGHRIEVLLDGRAVEGWPAGALSYALTEVYRGSYTLSVRVLDEQGNQVCAGPPSSFHVRQATIFSPARRQGG